MIVKVNNTNQHLIVNGSHCYLKEPEIIQLTQMFVNNDFSDKSSNVPDGYSITDATKYSGIVYPAAGQIQLKILYTGTGAGAILYSKTATYTFNTSHQYYMSFYCKTESSNCRMSFSNSYAHSGNTPLYANIPDNEWHRYSAIRQPYNTSTKNIFIGCGSSSTPLGEVGIFMKPMLFDLTADFGAGNEPTLEEFETIIGDNFLLAGTYNFIKI